MIWLTHPERDHTARHEPLREGRRRQHLDAVGVAQEPLEEDREAATHRARLGKRGEVVDDQPLAQLQLGGEPLGERVVERPEQDGGPLGAEPLAPDEAGAQLDTGMLAPPRDGEAARSSTSSSSSR